MFVCFVCGLLRDVVYFVCVRFVSVVCFMYLCVICVMYCVMLSGVFVCVLLY